MNAKKNKKVRVDWKRKALQAADNAEHIRKCLQRAIQVCEMSNCAIPTSWKMAAKKEIT